MSGRPRPLDGIRVIDLSLHPPGRYCTMLLGDFGADVTAIERPVSGGKPEEWELAGDPIHALFDALRRGKRRLELDLKSDEGCVRFDQLLAQADVVVEGFRPGVAARLGVDYERCRRLNAEIVYCSISGYGQTAPDAGEAGHDLDYLAKTGILGMLTPPDGRPAIPLNLLGDLAGGGLFAAYAIMLALFHRERGGGGQFVDLAMTDGLLSLLARAASLYLARGLDPVQRHYYLAGGLPYYDVYRASDGRWFAVAALERHFFATLCRLTGRPELVAAHGEPARYAEIAKHLTEWFGARSAEDAQSALEGEDTCVTIVSSLPEALEYADSRGLLVEVGGVRQVGVVPRLTATPGRPGAVDPERR